MTSGGDTIEARFLLELFAELSDGGIAYAVLDASQETTGIPDYSSDVDLVVDRHPVTSVQPVVEKLAKSFDGYMVQSMHYEVEAGYFFVVYLPSASGGCFVQLDVLFDPDALNRYFMPSGWLLQDRQRGRNEYCEVDRGRFAVYLLLKRLIKARMSADQAQELRGLLAGRAEWVWAELQRWMPAEMALHYQGLLSGADQGGIDSAGMRQLRRTFRWYQARQAPLRLGKRLAQDAIRKLGRLFQPTGLFVVLIAPDGAGKSTVAAALKPQLRRGFRSTFHFHWRPKLLPKIGGSAGGASSASPGTAPPRTSKYGFWLSLIRFLYYWTDFVLGYWLRIFPRRIASTLILGERYYRDVLVDPVRYGFALPVSLMSALGRLVPEPDLTILLAAEPAVIHARKQELEIPEIQRQLARYRQHGGGRARLIEVSTEQPVDAVVEEISTLIARYLHSRIMTRRGH